MHRIAVFAPMPADVVRERFPDVDVVVVGPDDDGPTLAAGATVAIADWIDRSRIDAAVVDALAPTCRLVQVPAAGVDSVDVDACARAGIPVASCAGLNATAVAEWCVWGAIDALRRLSWSDRRLREGAWEQFGHARFELAGRTVGIVGFGAIGRACAERFRGFEVDLRYWSRTRRPAEVEREVGATYSDLDDLIAAADVLVLAVALTADTNGLLSAARVTRLKPTAVVVNAARGGIVDEAALAAALADGRIHGAAIDVFTAEPAPPDHPLVGIERAVITPHVAGASAEAVGRIVERTFANVRTVLDGGAPLGVLDA